MRYNGSHSFPQQIQALEQLWFCCLQELVNEEPALSNMLLHAVSRCRVEAIALLCKSLLI